VSFLGRVDRNTLINEYGKAKILIFPSIWPEPCLTVILEAMALKLPIIASNIGGIPELITHGVNGLLFPTKDTETLSEYILKLLCDDELRKRLGENAYFTARSLDINEQIPQIIRVYNKYLV